MSAVFIPLFCSYQTCQAEVKLFQCFLFPACHLHRESRTKAFAWTDNKRAHRPIWLSEAINIFVFPPALLNLTSTLLICHWMPLLPPLWIHFCLAGSLSEPRRPWNDNVKLIHALNISRSYNYMKSNLYKRIFIYLYCIIKRGWERWGNAGEQGIK